MTTLEFYNLTVQTHLKIRQKQLCVIIHQTYKLVITTLFNEIQSSVFKCLICLLRKPFNYGDQLLTHCYFTPQNDATKNHQNQFYSQTRNDSRVRQRGFRNQFKFNLDRQQKRSQVEFEHNFDSQFGHVHQFEPKRSTKSNALWSIWTSARQSQTKQIGQLGKQLSKSKKLLETEQCK
ncbi:Hypothetical_protein [Hexamita inflata]|uniref:Hypothetical_protein n=1 Tax=Hexamita inflata TaxID=28002 RepID=A0ABP1H8H5_9EUKA